MESQERSRPVFLYLLVGAMALFVLVLVGFAFLWQDDPYSESASTFGSFSRKDAVGIIEIEGPIFDSIEWVEQLERYRKNDRVRALVVRIDSPGGAVAPSQELYDEILRISEEEGKPVVVSMGSVAASGGYYVAAAADRIVANPGTITGSIGVIMEFANFQELLGKIGIESRIITNSRGTFKDTGSPNRKMTAEEERLLKRLMDNVYEQFVAAVAYGRELDPQQVYPLADGRILSGAQALEAGLVDELGGFERAVAAAAELGEIDGEPVRLYPKKPKPNLLELLGGDVEGALSQALGGLLPRPRPWTGGGLYYLFVP